MIRRNTGTILSTAFLLVSFPSGSPAQESSPEITPDDLRRHVKFLASDELEGRGSGTEGNRKAAGYIASEFQRYGLMPAGDNGSFLQSFDFVSHVRLGSGNSVALRHASGTIELSPESDFVPFGFSTNDVISGPVAFLGFGISAPDKGYDDYADFDAQGMVVVVLRGGPDGNDPHGDLFRQSSFRSKVRAAREHGAIAMIAISGPDTSFQDEVVKLAYDHAFASSGIVAVSMKRDPIQTLMQIEGKDLAAIVERLKSGRKPESFRLQGVTADIRTNIEHIKATTSNVVGYLPGGEKHSGKEVVVIGAHMDHLGYGGPGSGSLMPDTNAVHNGADDNASGSAGLLELAEAFSADKSRTGRTIVFIAFSGEEMGTLGSGHYVSSPSLPLDRTVAMINMDMIGRLENNVLTVNGTGTSPMWDSLLQRHNADSLFSLKYVPDGFGPSDHAQFYGKNIPVLFFFTGIHADYHKPSDDWDKINYAGEASVVTFIQSVVRDVIAAPAPPAFAAVQSSGQGMGGGDGQPFTVTLGVIPDYGSNVEGMKVGGLRPNGPAEKAGIKSGDVIVAMNGKKVLNIYDYMAILGELKPGDKPLVEIMRDGARLSVQPLMEKRR
jgi:hypothetical protein